MTEAGSTVLRESSPLIHQVASRFQARYGQRQLRVTVQPFFATELLVPRLSSFISENSEIAINIDTEDQSAEKHPARADVSIRLFRRTPKDLDIDELFWLRLVPACSPALAERLPDNEQTSMEGLPLIVHSKRPNAWLDWASSIGVANVDLSNAIRLETMISVARAAEQGLGVALVPLPLSESWFRSGKLERLSEHELKTDDRYLMVGRKEDGQRTEVQAFRRWILQEFGMAR